MENDLLNLASLLENREGMFDLYEGIFTLQDGTKIILPSELMEHFRINKRPGLRFLDLPKLEIKEIMQILSALLKEAPADIKIICSNFGVGFQSNKIYILPDFVKTKENLKEFLLFQSKIRYISFRAIDFGGDITSEIIPVERFFEEPEIIETGIQTDGSSIVLPLISSIIDAKVQVVPDKSLKWVVDYNEQTGLGTLEIYSHLVHSDVIEKHAQIIAINDNVDSIHISQQAEQFLQKELTPIIFDHYPYVKKVHSIDVYLGTELEAWVGVPYESGRVNKEIKLLQLTQGLHSNYWKKPEGILRSAMEETIDALEKYGLSPEMCHKEVGGIEVRYSPDGTQEEIAQIEFDWKYAQSIANGAINEISAKEIIKKVFRKYNLTISFKAKPIRGVAGNGEHNHISIIADIETIDGTRTKLNLFHNYNNDSFLSRIGWGALLGILRNWYVINSFISNSIDALERLKPGFEAPISPSCSICLDEDSQFNCLAKLKELRAISPDSRNDYLFTLSAKYNPRRRDVAVGVISEIKNPISTRFEIRSPNPETNNFLSVSAIVLAMIQGIKEVKDISLADIEQLFSTRDKNTHRYFSTKENIYKMPKNERVDKFGESPLTPFQSLQQLQNKANLKFLYDSEVFSETLIDSYYQAMIQKWLLELSGEIISEIYEQLRKINKPQSIWESPKVWINWEKIDELKNNVLKSTLLLEELIGKTVGQTADENALKKISELQIIVQENYNNLLILAGKL